MEDTLIKLNRLYAQIKKVNNDLLAISNSKDYENASFEDAMMLTISSNGLSLIKSLFQENTNAITCILNQRNIIESFALALMNADGDITPQQLELFKEQYAIIEYQQYDETDKEIFKDLNDFKDLKRRYFKARQHFLDAGVSEKVFTKISQSRAPFLLDPDFNFNKIIKKYISDEMNNMYSRLSVFVHPRAYQMIESNEYLIESSNIVIGLLITLFKDKDPGDNLGYFEESRLIYGFDIDSDLNYGKRLFDYQKKEWESILRIVNAFEEVYSKGSYPAMFFKDLTLVLHDINTDSQLGLTENAKMKFKVVSEMFAVFDKIYFSQIDASYLTKLFELHEKINYEVVCGDEYDNKKRTIAFDIYKNTFPETQLTKNQFIKEYKRPLGYLINKEGKSPGFNKLVRDYYSSLQFGKIKDSEIDFERLYRLMYKESQAMSHGSGYLYFTNTGAWQDDINVVVALDRFMYSLIFKIKSLFGVFKEDSTNNLKIYNCLEKELNELDSIFEKKFQILSSVQRIKKNF